MRVFDEFTEGAAFNRYTAVAGNDEAEPLVTNSINSTHCLHCNQVKEYGTEHCLDCQRCVRHYSHHSAFYNRCISEDNHLAYMMVIII
jgi:hypothetical protein